MDKIQALIDSLKVETMNDTFWKKEISNLSKSNRSIHLAIFIEPFLEWVLSGQKTIESRFSVNKCAPYKKIHEGDIILLKKSGGPICGIAEASNLWFYELDPESWKEIKNDFAKGICAQDPSFWEQRENASFATLIKLKNVKTLNPVFFPKKDRRGWVILLNNSTPPILKN